jgi:uncharacterized protein
VFTLSPELSQRINTAPERLAEFCERWQVAELAFFGSVLREDFRPDSDVDVLVSFRPDCASTLDDLLDMREELQSLFGRKVDLLEQDAIRNPYRRKSILTTKQVVHAA